jgi:carbon-monoxide dehydrogenase large subunit
VVYDKESGQLLTGSLLDYCLPRADDLPAFQVTFAETTPAETNPLGAKGIGEVGAIAAPPAVMNALIDALSPLGIGDIDMPATSEKIWRAIRDAQG